MVNCISVAIYIAQYYINSMIDGNNVEKHYFADITKRKVVEIVRLIDADVLMGKLTMSNIAHSQNSRELSLLNRNLKIVMDMPTAYSVEKVVEELEQQAEQYKRRALELVEKSTEAGIHNKGKSLSYEHAIEIVRNGGKE